VVKWLTMKTPKPYRLSPRSAKVTPFYVMELLEKAQILEAQGENIVHMEIGEPDFPTPETVKEAAVRAINEGRTFYTHSLGLKELRERIAGHYAETRHVEVSPERIVVTNGTSGAFFLLCAVLLDRRKNFVISDPGYPCYRNFGTLFDARVISLPVSETSRFEISPEQLDGTGVTPHLLMVCSPSNPTGTEYRKESLAKLHSRVGAQGGLMVVDEIYSGLTYGGTWTSALAISDDIAVVDGFSKTYAMTGWRLGWIVVPQSLIRPMQKVAQNVFISAPTVAQYGAMHAFDARDELETMRKTYMERRDYLFPRLGQLGFGLTVLPDGAFYIYADIGKWGMDSMIFTERALQEARVAITPGYDFGSHRAGTHVRFSYASDLENLREGCRRLEEWLDKL
jgi:aspartate/methionine/tyrosine aminotransferase